MDVSAVSTALGGVEANIETIGLVLLGLAAVAVGIKWLKATIFG